MFLEKIVIDCKSMLCYNQHIANKEEHCYQAYI